jgi:(E)-4-hydroxy-3-methylbut-2-enyl-diphosphate synthase
MSLLLSQGIGDTIRVSLTDDPVKEVEAGKQILYSLGLKKRDYEIISCPTCGRTEIGLLKLVEEVERAVKREKINLKVAVMGCVVNGPGEAKEADIGVAGGGGVGTIFVKGKQVKMVAEDKIVEELIRTAKTLT